MVFFSIYTSFSMKKITLLALCLLVNILSFGQKRQAIYTKAVDEINCKATKTLLGAYNRAATARSIQICTYDEIQLGIERVQENKLKGYKQKIADLSTEIDAYKKKVSDSKNDKDYAAAFEELNDMILSRFRKMCEQDQALAPDICPNLDAKVLGLQGDLNDISDESLKQIKRYNTGEQSQTTATVSPKPPVTEKTNKPTEEATQPSISGSGLSGFTTTFVFLLIIGLAAVCGWLYKEVNDLKEQLEDLKTLVNILNKQKN